MASHLSSTSTNLTRGLAAHRLFRGPPCHKGTLHLQTPMPSLGFEPRPYGTAVSIINHYTGWDKISKEDCHGWDVVQSGRRIFDDFFQHLWPYIGNNTANVVFQMVKRLWLIRLDQ
ncbi:hypothetical protein TNCV_243501 [Trichonephila clavipes]|uniref:Uncharacterized protein n=1 Tax=Trichonephila clavipes TaxID=2585209 RepID=A0A8X7BDS1_TRICX|nr:hypothetical protein TNCV_243501 [Trichonephila clavipes]